MDKNEVIILSSDEETETTDRIQKTYHTTVTITSDLNVSTEVGKKFKNNVFEPIVIIKNKEEFTKTKDDRKQCRVKSKDNPEVVDLVDFLDKGDNDKKPDSVKISPDLDVIDLEETSTKNNTENDENTKADHDSSADTTNPCNSSSAVEESKNTKNESNQSLQFFTEFIEYCGSLEKVPEDRARLRKKLMKRYGEADCNYLKSEKFKCLIKKCRDKVNVNNLYLIAKEITEELSYKKKITIQTNRLATNKQKNQSQPEVNEEIEEKPVKISEKRTRFINKVIKKLDKLGSKIRELEEKEVDLSDEEESTYVLLQRYRDRFCQIYKKFCAYTNQIPDPNNRKICFTESKYPAINKSIENWLNKTKRFPDFIDIMKLLECQSSSLGLPANKEAIRSIASEIFQKVGVMLQRKRIYDLWDIFCGFLDDGKDPAEDDPNLDQILKANFETRLKKEQEIFQHYTELQEKEKLKAEEVADEEASCSPVDSGNEDDKEIEEIENCMNKRLDDAIKNTEESGLAESKDENNSEIDISTSSKPEDTIKSKETKNNYKNCKSLKYRKENSEKSKNGTSNSEDSSTGTENEKVKSENGTTSSEWKPKEKSVEVDKGDSDLELIAVKETKVGNKTQPVGHPPNKRIPTTRLYDLVSKKMKLKEKKTDDFDIFEIDENGKTNQVFGVRCCQVFPDSVFQDLSGDKKDWTKRKVFRDLTNVNRLMELHGRRKKMSGLFSPSFFHRSFSEFEKPSWKKRFKVSYRLVGSKDQKCALNQEEKSTKSVNSDSGGDSDEKDIRSEGGGDGGDQFCKKHGNGSEEDNNEDENKKSGGNNGEINDNQHEEEEEEEEENESEKIDNNTENLNQSTNKTEELLNSSENHSEENKEAIQELVTETEVPVSSLEDAQNNEKTEEEQENCEEACDVPEKVNIKEEHVQVDDEKTEGEEIEEIAVESVQVEKVEVKTESSKDIGTEMKKESISLTKLKDHIESLKTPLETNNINTGRITPEKIVVQPAIWHSSYFVRKPPKKNPPTDEERVKRFLLHSPSSISITPPKKLTLSKPPSQAALQALATLRNLKDISATIVRSKPKPENDVVVVDNAAKRQPSPKTTPSKRRRNDLPIISSVQSMVGTPTILTVEGNVSGFEDSVSWNEEPETSSIRIANVWGNLPGSFMTNPNKIESASPSCSSLPTRKKKNTKKTVEYVVLE